MKKLACFIAIVSLAMLFGCTNDILTDENQGLNLELKKANVPVPMKVDLCAVPDMNSSLILKPGPDVDPNDPNSYVTSRMIFSGNGTHLGKVDPEKSYYQIDVFELIMENGTPYFYQSGTGFVAGANGDGFSDTWWAKASLPNLDYVGGIEITGGTGKFEGCTGAYDMVGTFDEETLMNCLRGEGFIEFDAN